MKILPRQRPTGTTWGTRRSVTRARLRCLIWMETPFHHIEQSLRVVDKLERDGDGLNLTYEVRMAILGHTGPRIPETLEGQVVRTSDRIAYINHDIDDAIRAEILSESEIPRERLRTFWGAFALGAHQYLGGGHDLKHAEHGRFIHASEVSDATGRAAYVHVFERVHTNPVVGAKRPRRRISCASFLTTTIRILTSCYDFIPQLDFDGISRTICDYIAGMTDKYAIYTYSEIFIPTAWQVR